MRLTNILIIITIFTKIIRESYEREDSRRVLPDGGMAKDKE